ncbi:PadR family transcriptional regulator [Microbacterium trichothecenolyticum]|uniref:PadR family transcriptional regulator n=1 Tax=Microbacterium ureisolvens TaxID=2781186 RepID=A0ABS7HVE2_9MICO|nr:MULTISPECIES: PaaX family transcriptional regulator C-terminal domain-containing protein [Microbacterium]MBW9109326.1 PadR family transcriptional regulator [Microbacterium ureisolvens]MBW9120024.1 PadR family transcriptional regulator [Microbacterium trichothecenolyticum]
MSVVSTADASILTRKPRQLLLAFFGEFVCDRYFEPLRASVLIGALESAGVAASAVRTNLDRMVHSGMLERRRLGREIGFELTGHGSEVLREASHRVNGPAPFEPQGEGWTLVTFSVPEHLRDLRHRLRAALTWSGFAVLRDGLWVAPGAVDLAAALGAIIPDLPPGSVNAFSASELDGFPMAETVRVAWDIEGIRAAHAEFIEHWEREDAASELPAVTARTLLVADWLALLRADPRLPRQYMGEDWPADRSFELFTRRHREFAFPAVRDFAGLVD